MLDKERIKQLEADVLDLQLQLEAKEGIKQLLTNCIERRAENAESDRDYWRTRAAREE